MAHPTAYPMRTDHTNFGKSLDGIPSEVKEIVHDITRRRQGVEAGLTHYDAAPETIINTLKEYLTMQKTLESIKTKVKKSSRLKFKWTSFLSEDKYEVQDVESEMTSMLLAAGLWHMEHANVLNRSITDEDEDEQKMKDAVHSLKTSAGIFDSLDGQSLGCKDIDVMAIRALRLQSLAEAQCVTVRRAITKNHKAMLISELCHDVASKYCSAAKNIGGDTSSHLKKKWMCYLKFQSEVYFALARCFQGINLLEAEDKCGESIVVLRESSKHIEQAKAFAKEYDKLKPKTKVHLDESQQLIRVKKLINEKQAKSDRENGMIYHQRLPEECLPLYEPKCVVQPTAFHLPDSHDLTSVQSATDVDASGTDDS
ncbi:BRO1 domain-containing protein BROX [Nematostella vectensis]|uniref:BRO1 domain-containing protein BROX n=1 Tax=Nematostella vectensis TaxID=45351 RepID=UPI002076E988|nr:BRO1 domain-containing protein BROX [Nematostella vectensis]